MGATNRVPQTTDVRRRNAFVQSYRARGPTSLHVYPALFQPSHPTALDAKPWKWKSGGTTKNITRMEYLRCVCVCVCVCTVLMDFDIGEFDGVLD